MNSHILNKYFSCHSKIDVLRTIVFSTESLSGRQIASRSSLSPRSCQLSLDDLVSMNALIRRPSGKAYYYSLNTDNLVITDFVIPIIQQEKRIMDRAVKLVKKQTADLEDQHVGLYLLNIWPKEQWNTKDGDLLLLRISQDGDNRSLSQLAEAAALLKERFGFQVARKVLSPGDLAMGDSPPPDMDHLITEVRTIHGTRFRELLAESKTPPEHFQQSSDFFSS